MHKEKLLISKCTRPWQAQEVLAMSVQEHRENLESIKKQLFL
jgi:hypothetical protein